MQLAGKYTEFTYFSNTIILQTFFFQVKKVSHADGSKRRKALKHNFGYNIGFIRLIFVK